MERLNDYRMRGLVGTVITLFALNTVTIKAQDGRPVADAGLSRYAGPDPIVLDGTGSYDPDSSDPLSYMWRQMSGPSVVIIDTNTATPTIAGSIQSGQGRDQTPRPQGFTQTEEIQECEFELVVSDGKLTSLPDTVKVLIVPDFGANKLIQSGRPPFDPDKPTMVHFAGMGGCQNCAGWSLSGAWDVRVNQIVFGSFHASAL